MRFKLAFCVALAVVLQSSLRAVWPPLAYVELPLIVVVYFALQRDALLAVITGTVAGLASDVLSSGLLGARGFTYTLVAYLVAALMTRVMIDNPLLRIPVFAGASALSALVYVFLHRLLGQDITPMGNTLSETAAFSIIWTTVGGTLLAFPLDALFSEKSRTRRQFAFRRRIARRGLRRRKP